MAVNLRKRSWRPLSLYTVNLQPEFHARIPVCTIAAVEIGEIHHSFLHNFRNVGLKNAADAYSYCWGCSLTSFSEVVGGIA